MTRHLSPAELRNSAAKLSVSAIAFTKEQKLEFFASAYAAIATHRLATLEGMEYMPPEKFRTCSTRGTAFEQGIKGLNKAGVPTEQTFGSLMDSTGLSQDELHDIACGCAYPEGILASHVAYNVRTIGSGGVIVR